MLPSILYAFVHLILDLMSLPFRDSAARDVELLGLRHEVRVLRRQTRPGALAGVPVTGWSCLPVRPETLLRWHRELVRRKGAAFGRRRGPGRPPLPADCRQLLRRLARENPGWGYQRVGGELLKLGYSVSATTIRSVLREQGVPPAPRQGGLAWRAFLGAQARAVIACDFFTVETLRLQTLSVLFFLELRTRRAFLAGCTERPSTSWVTQQACNLVWDLEEADVEAALLLRDGDSKFTPAFDTVFSSHGVRVIRTPIRALRANAYAKRWVGSVRRECLAWVLLLGRKHLELVLCESVSHYNRARPHRALQLWAPREPKLPASPGGLVRRRDLLGGVIHEYSRQVA